MKYLICLLMLTTCSCVSAPSVLSSPTIAITPSRTASPTRTLIPTLTPFFTKTSPATKTRTITPTIPSSLLTPEPLYTAVARVATPVSYPGNPISVANADQLHLLAQWGQGMLTDISYSADGSLLAIATTTGVAIYDGQDLILSFFLDSLEKIDSIELSPDDRFLAAVSDNKRKLRFGISVLNSWSATSG